MSSDPSAADTAAGLPTPALLLELDKLKANVGRLCAHLRPLGTAIRPHLKTVKSIEAARLILQSTGGGATVSTLREAEAYGAAGITDLLYAVGVTPAKLDRVLGLRRQGIDLSVVVDSVEAARAVAAASRRGGDPIPTLIEVDTDGHRAGVAWSDGPQLIAVGRALHEGGARLRGVMTHAGDSYNRPGPEALAAIAEEERAGAVHAAQALRADGLPAPVVSVGSTPTALFARHLEGVTEVRAGVFGFFDLVMAGIGVCGVDEIALSVLTEVIGHQLHRGWILIDAGWMALSRDRGTSRQRLDQGYGLVCDLHGKPYPDLIVADANQEQGIVALRPGSAAALPELPLGTRLRILPNHACATGAQHDRYEVVQDSEGKLLGQWGRFRGW